ncbi:nicotianamine synthase family protein [Desulfonatronovibrio hydrogenovorans]|uniref:nicotianamine synthase family protein n=1 Tax=Desulfonatronovibrio hydrogenovorans TaxID=53245 RepID=UPI0013774D5C|nr:nicotianamine synthase family protein [Desulfonatronovibrio hydrogenovorans]
MSWIPPVIKAWEKLSSASRVLTWVYSKPYKQVLENEIRLGRLCSTDVVLNIGCGAVPFTALYLATLTGARVYAVDIDPRAVALARKCVHNAGLGHRISVIRKNGTEPFDRPFSAAIVALQAEPKNRIMQVMKKTACSGARLIFRLPSPAYRDHYDNLLTDQTAAGVASQPMRTFDRSVLYLNAA